ncbi:hypothetical protein CF326_g7561 [Tilletia indica]|nr:hypothetical protein CF326_g7561 [Tilletia indica]
MVNVHSTSLLLILSTLLASIALAAPSSHSHLPSAAHTKVLHTRTAHPSLNHEVNPLRRNPERIHRLQGPRRRCLPGGLDSCGMASFYGRAASELDRSYLVLDNKAIAARGYRDESGRNEDVGFGRLYAASCSSVLQDALCASQFLARHRWLLHARDLAMRDCGFEGPFRYWDWSVDADTGDIQKSPIFTNTFGLGGNGSSPDGIVTTGPFDYMPASINNFSAFATALERMRRGFEVGNPGTWIAWRRAPRYWRYDDALSQLERPESSGSTTPTWDRLWWFWQNGDTTGRGPPSYTVDTSDLNGRFWSYSGHTVQYDPDRTGGAEASLFDVQTLEGLFLPNIETYKLMDTTRPPLCYKYT